MRWSLVLLLVSTGMACKRTQSPPPAVASQEALPTSPAPAELAARDGRTGSAAGTAAGTAHPNAAGIAGPHAGIAAPPVNVGDVRVPKAEGPDARTVAEVFSQRSSLKGKKVAVRGKVVKVSPEIMGLNWVHLRDGTGSADKSNDDLTVTTKDTAAAGDVVVARGVVKTDMDFGLGYTYPAMVQDAKLTK